MCREIVIVLCAIVTMASNYTITADGIDNTDVILCQELRSREREHFEGNVDIQYVMADVDVPMGLMIREGAAGKTISFVQNLLLCQRR